MVRRAAYCQLSVEMFGSEVGVSTPSFSTPLIACNWEPMLALTAPGPPKPAPICSTFTLWMLPFAALYWKIPCCAGGLSTVVEALMLRLDRFRVRAEEEKFVL